MNLKNTKYSMKFEQDILKIKKIMDINKRREAVLKVAAAHGISDKTIYRHMKKKVPGVRKVRKDSGKDKTPVTKKERSMVSELIRSGKTRDQAKEILNEVNDKKISVRKMSKINKKIKEDILPDNDATLETNFGSAALEFIRKLFELDLIAPDSGLKFKYNNVQFLINKKQLEDIASICATAYNDHVTDDGLKLKGDHIDQLQQQLYYDIQELRRLVKASGNIKDVEALTRMFDRLKSKNVDMTPDFYVLEKCLKEIKPAITREQVIALVKKNTEK